jgi:hypothetical protein
MPLTAITTSNLDTTNSLFFRNRIINGAMMIDQRNAGASFTNSNQNLVGLDRWRHYGLSGAVLTLQQSTVAPAGFFNSQLVTVTTSTTANDSGGLGTRIEGNNVSDFSWGTSSGSSVTISFWVRSSVTGTYNVLVSFAGSTSNYYYVATYTVSASNTWEYKTITISAPPVGAGVFNAGLTAQYAEVRFVISSSGGPSTTANTWSTSTTPKSSGCVDLASNAGATFYITGVQLEKGTAATAFEYRPITTELQLCQRYYNNVILGDSVGIIGLADNTTAGISIYVYPVQMRTSPTLVTTGTASNYRIRRAGGVTTCSAVPALGGANEQNTTMARVNSTVASGLTAGQSIYLDSNSGNVNIAFSAEL